MNGPTIQVNTATATRGGFWLKDLKGVILQPSPKEMGMLSYLSDPKTREAHRTLLIAGVAVSSVARKRNKFETDSNDGH